MEALIWDNTSLNGADHGPSCAAFASLTLELAAQAVGQQSWVSGGTSYPWPLPAWADVRVDTNPASPAVTSMVADAQAHGRWHPLSDGYQPQPGDWVLFEHHVEVVTSYSDGVLDTIGADSDPGLTVNAHSFAARWRRTACRASSTTGTSPPPRSTARAQRRVTARAPAASAAPSHSAEAAASAASGTADVPGVAQAAAAGAPAAASRSTATASASSGTAAVPGVVKPSGTSVTASPVSRSGSQALDDRGSRRRSPARCRSPSPRLGTQPPRRGPPPSPGPARALRRRSRPRRRPPAERGRRAPPAAAPPRRAPRPRRRRAPPPPLPPLRTTGSTLRPRRRRRGRGRSRRSSA